MVKIIELKDDLVSEEEAKNTDEDITEEEDDGLETDLEQKLPDPPESPEPPLSLDVSLMLDTSTPAEVTGAPSSASEGIRRCTLGASIIPPSPRVSSTSLLWNLIAQQYGHHVEFDNGDPQLEHSTTATDTFNIPGPPTETASVGNRNSQLVPNVSQITSDAIEKEEDKMESDESTKEKSNGVCEKEQLAAKAAAAKTDQLTSPELSDCELSDMSDPHAPPDYDTLQAAIKDENYTTTSSTEGSWATVRKSTGMDDHKTELIDSADEKEFSKESEEGDEAACLPSHRVVKDNWEQWIDDDELFTVTDDIHAPSTSAEVRMPSSANPTNERRRFKLESRQSLRKRERAAIVERFIFVPTAKIGRILGKGGRRIKEIEKKTGARIKIEHRRSNKPVTQVSLTGTEEQICKADEEICTIARNFKPAKSGEAMTASVSSQEEKAIKQLIIGIKNQVLDAEKRCREP